MTSEKTSKPVSLSKGSPLIVALDYHDQNQALKMADLLDPEACRVKVGKELFTSSGPSVVEALQRKGFDVFLDLKFHDIPNTTANAVAVAAELGVWMVNVHASGGRKMMDACVNKLANFTQKPLLIGVTVLTSMAENDLKEVGVQASPMDHVLALANQAKLSGLDGVVCSAHETALLHDNFGQDFNLVTPGIRPSFAEKGDQKRIMTPRDALLAGSDYLVVGRPITQSGNPSESLKKVMAEISIAQ